MIHSVFSVFVLRSRAMADFARRFAVFIPFLKLYMGATYLQSRVTVSLKRLKATIFFQASY